ncbi:MAG TPA: hypothetical protein VH063_08900 [Gaiellaceae bacterium]|jgi:hypothetical protein|nr:hypothetical protein [Gaiellaceae bacterium]
MDEAEKVVERLRRISELNRIEAAPARLLEELRELVGEAEGWADVEGDARARAAALELGQALDRGGSARSDSPRGQEGEVSHRVGVH